MTRPEHDQDRRRGPSWIALSLILLFVSNTSMAQFDHSHARWSALLGQHVQWNQSAVASVVDYAGFQRDRATLQSYLQSLSAVSEPQYSSWKQSERDAFLINAYNAFTVDLVLTRYPNLESIKELGGFLSGPWKLRFVSLLGKTRSLDEIEHEMLRGNKTYNDPRIHFAVNCASIGCPALRPEAYIGERLAAQLDDQTKRFLRDRSRNFVDVKNKNVVISPIFDWYEADFKRGLLATYSVHDFLYRHRRELGFTNVPPSAHDWATWRIKYSRYDWRLNHKP